MGAERLHLKLEVRSHLPHGFLNSVAYKATYCKLALSQTSRGQE